MRLDPFYMPQAPLWLGFAHYMLKQYLQALPPLREYVSRAPNFRGGHACLAATYAQLGKLEEARAEAVEVLRIEPTWTIEGTQARLSPFKSTQDAEHYFDGLRKARAAGTMIRAKSREGKREISSAVAANSQETLWRVRSPPNS